MNNYDDLWRCEWCGKKYVVPGLARDCEDRHLASDEESP